MRMVGPGADEYSTTNHCCLHRRFISLLCIICLASVIPGCMSSERGLKKVLSLNSNRHMHELVMPRQIVTLDGETNVELNWAATEDPRVSKKPVMLFVHGYPSSLFSWREMFDNSTLGQSELENKFNLVAIDLPGHGFTKVPKNFDDEYLQPDKAAGAVVKFMDSTGIDSAVLVGNSFGGLVACYVASDHRLRVDGLVLIDSEGVARTEPHEVFGSEAMICRAPFLYSLGYPIASLLVKSELKSLMSDLRKVIPDQLREYKILMKMKREYDTNGYLVKSMVCPKEPRSDEQMLEILGSSFTNPVLIIWGCQDRLFPMSKHAERFRAWFRGAKFAAICDSGHCPQEETPEAVIRAILEYAK